MTKSKKRPTIEKASEPIISQPTIVEPNQDTNIKLTLCESSPPPKPAAKKPKKSKVTNTTSNTTQREQEQTPPIANIIMHLKCSINDLEEYNNDINKKLIDPLTYKPIIPPDIMTYQHTENYAEFGESKNTAPQENFAYLESKTRYIQDHTTDKQPAEDTENPDLVETTTQQPVTNMKEINSKLKKLKLSLFKNMTLVEKKSACFWCTYDFDNNECYIPRYDMDGTMYGYGCFCRPECAAAFLMKENLDDSTKFERYHLLNQVYSKVFDYKKNIKPAPNPYYLLDKYYGNLTIQEYRKLLKSDHLLLVIEKPMTRILPELHEDNEEFLSNIYCNSSVLSTTTGPKSATTFGTYKVRKQSEKSSTVTKSSIIKEHFGIKDHGSVTN
jgi:hypothetical protein